MWRDAGGQLAPQLISSRRLVLSTPELAQALTQEPSVSSLISKALEADYKLVGIGGLSETATVVTQGYLPQ